MKLKHDDIIIDPDNPFTNCKLERKQYAEVLTSIVGNYADGFVLAINNKWGTGKTTFVKMWRQQLINKKFTTLYFNAWENDFQNDVLVALISELEELRDKGEEKFKKVLNNTVPLLKKIAPSILKHFAEKAMGEGAVAEIIKAVGEYGVDQLKEEIDSFTKKKNGIAEFRKSLEVFVQEVDPEKPVVFIIDELDRCRPNYAVEVLEQIKHLFAVPGIVFVLSIDKEQLGNAIRGFYGSDRIDADEYLRRFIDLEYAIPKPSTRSFIEYLYQYYDFVSFVNDPKRLQGGDFKHDKSRLRDVAVFLFSKERYSLRQMQKTFARVRLTITAFHKDQNISPQLILFISFLDNKHPDIYKDIKEMNFTLQDFVSKMDEVLIPLLDSVNKRKIQSLMADLISSYSKDYFRIRHTTNERVFYENNEEGLQGLALKTKLEDDNHAIAGIIESLNRGFSTRDVNLSWITNKYDLMDNIVS